MARAVMGLFISKRLPFQRHRVEERNTKARMAAPGAGAADKRGGVYANSGGPAFEGLATAEARSRRTGQGKAPGSCLVYYELSLTSRRKYMFLSRVPQLWRTA